MSGRSPIRTDYIYHVTTADAWVVTRPAHRTLKGAKAAAATGLMQPRVAKVAPHVWHVLSGIPGSPCRSTITRTPLVN